MESPSQIERRQAWARSTRRKFTVRETENLDPHLHASLQDDVFMDGCSAGKIETWLQGCGNDASQAKNSHQTVGPLRTGASFEDDLSLGAEATALYTASNVSQFSTRQQKLSLPLLNMGQSVASSALSAATSRTVSSVNDVLQMRAEDAEDTLYQLGFGCEEPQVTARIPLRFFNFPSQLRGINFRLFLESQLSRIHQEDPCLSLASRFRQVEALTAMANAFYSLYSHVSRTPLQKLAPPQLTLTSPITERTMFRSSVRSEPRSPVERLKDTISKMCLYTGSRGSDSASPSGSPRKRKSLSDKTESWNVNADDQGTIPDLDMEVDDLEKDMDWYTETFELRSDETEDVPLLNSGDKEKVTLSTLSDCTQSDKEMESDGSNLPSVSLKNTSVTMVPVPVITHDVIHPQVIEYVNQAPYHCTDVTDSQPSLKQSYLMNLTITSQNDQAAAPHDALSENRPDDLSSEHAVSPQKSLCQITVTGWEGDAIVPNKDAHEVCSFDVQKQLSTMQLLNLSRLNQCPKQGNSFELEEVHSAEEEEATSSELSPTVTLCVSTHHQKSSPLRGDSFQSDSSGFAEEEFPHCLSIPEKRIVTKVTSDAQQDQE
ncbi:uncharacterized protein tespa1 isoform X1 [Paramisgurnus dabryanus]|uniref:uncharacterized protein tespa1 isoform X1 n=2 Tax=Paramisgurnus dabryanus TaxID=90735 RepID=UPI0031F354F5